MTTASPSTDFIRTIINEDLRKNTHDGKVVTRFPPEPNGYLHIGHAKSICLNFGLATEYKGSCHLRFDDTDPIKEETHFEEAIKEAVHWLGFDWGNDLYHASDYFDKLYELAVQLIKMGKAYVCDQTLEEIREFRGTVTEAGRNCSYRERSVEENLDLFERMKAGEFGDGEKVLRAKIDMSAANMKMRDPVLYRIRHVSHHMTGDKWCIYPLYDFTHPLSDCIEGITHSICTLEFENNREFYDWIVNTLDMPVKSRQYEFARLNINYTVMSKRKILQLVEGGHVSGWDDPRLLTIAGLRRRGYTAPAIRRFCNDVGIAKANSTVDMAQLEFSIRDDLNHKAPRVLAVLEPLKVTITNYPDGKTEQLEASYWPEDVPKEGTRPLPFSREIYIERSDFMEEPPKGYFRLAPGREVRLRHAYIIRCDDVVRDANGAVSELRCSYDEATPLGENPSDGRKIKGTIHWVDAAASVPVAVRAYDRLFSVDNPSAEEDFLSVLNKNSLLSYPEARIEPSVLGSAAETHFQFERHGFFVTDRHDSKPDSLVFNRTVTLKDSWSKKKKPEAPKAKPKPQTTPAAPKKEVVLTESEQAAVDQLMQSHDLPKDHAILLTQDERLGGYFQETLNHCKHPKDAANWTINEVQRQFKEEEEAALVSPAQLAGLLNAVNSGIISSKQAKQVFAELAKSDKSADAVIQELGLKQISDPAELLPFVEQVLQAHPDVLEEIRGGRDKKIGFLVGQIMSATGGKASPKLVNQLLKERI